MMGGNGAPVPPSRLPSSGPMRFSTEGGGNQGVSNVFDTLCLVRGTFLWRWGESNPHQLHRVMAGQRRFRW
jgi:hypothetical protein